MLTECSFRRGAATDPRQLAVYAVDLAAYDLGIVEEVLLKLGRTKRADGEMAIPEVGDLIGRIRGEIRARRPSVDQESADRWTAYIAAAKAEGVEEPDGEILSKIAALNEKHSLSKPKVIDTTPVMQSCPHCSQGLPVAPNLRFWTVLELREYADVLESNMNARLSL